MGASVALSVRQEPLDARSSGTRNRAFSSSLLSQPGFGYTKRKQTALLRLNLPRIVEGLLVLVFLHVMLDMAASFRALSQDRGSH